MSDGLTKVIGHLEQASKDGVLDRDEVRSAIALLRATQGASETNRGPESQDRREMILRVAARVFAEKGYHGTNLQDIASEVGCTRPTFYYYFKNKQEILATITDAALSRAENVLDMVVATDGTSVDRIRLFVREYVRINATHPEAPVLFRTIHELPSEALEQIQARRSAIDHQLAEMIEEGVREGTLRSRAPLITTFGILGAVNWMHVWYQPDKRLSWEEIADLMSDLLLNGLAVPSR